MAKYITIIGGGQLGAFLSYNLLRLGKKVVLIDEGTKEIRKNAQVPWGWMRKFSLQSELKKNLVNNDSFLPDIKISKNYGPMLISSMNNNSIIQWKEWLKNNSDSDGKVFNPKEAYTLFNLNEDYFQGKGGIFMCDSRDFIMDFSKVNEQIWDYLHNDKNCKIIENCKVNSIISKDNIASHLVTDIGRLNIDKVVLCIGNQSKQLFDINTPKLNIKLPYTYLNNDLNKKYIGLWNKDSSLTLFKNNKIKLSCGTQSIFDFSQLNLYNSLNFSKMGLNGFSNLNYNKLPIDLIESAISELKIINDDDINLKYKEIDYCDIDLTPSLCPYIHFLKNSNNILNINGFSGSGSMIYDNNFINLIIDSIDNNNIHKNLIEFQPPNSIIKNIFIPNNKKTPLSSIV